MMGGGDVSPFEGIFSILTIFMVAAAPVSAAAGGLWNGVQYSD